MANPSSMLSLILLSLLTLFVHVVMATPCPPNHAIFLVHGLRGRALDLLYLEGRIQSEYGDQVVVFRPSVVESHSFKGIDVCSSILLDYVRETLRQHPEITRCSFVGHSLGGLLVRHLLRDLHQQNLLQGIELVDLVTFATPHMGSRHLFDGLFWLRDVVLRFVNTYISRTLSQLVIEDGGDDATPLLVRMATEDEFVSPLTKFKRIVFYANVCGDWKVDYQSSSARQAIGIQTSHFSSLTPPYGMVVADDTVEAAYAGLDALEGLMHSGLNKLKLTRFAVFGRIFFAHDDIVVRREAVNEVAGKPVVDHFIMNFHPNAETTPPAKM